MREHLGLALVWGTFVSDLFCLLWHFYLIKQWTSSLDQPATVELYLLSGTEVESQVWYKASKSLKPHLPNFSSTLNNAKWPLLYVCPDFHSSMFLFAEYEEHSGKG